MSAQSRLLTVSGTALLLAVTSVGAPAAWAAAPASFLNATAVPTVPAPPTKVLPTAMDVTTPYEAQVSCDPRPKPGVIAFGALMSSLYKTGVTGTYRPCLGDVSEHYESRALDWMNNVNDPHQKAVADSVVAWLSADNGVMARRFGISYIIWNRKMWREYRPEQGWAAYTGPVPHTDHIHFSFSWDGAMARTSWWTGKATTAVDLGPCQVYAGQFAPLYTAARTGACRTSPVAAPVSSYAVAAYGQTSAQIAAAQVVLGVPAGQFGMTTFNALVSWQARSGVPITGVLDKATWARMFPTTPPAAVTPAPKPAPAPATTVAAPVVATPYTAYKTVVLRQGSKGAAVVVLQRALKATPDGDFGPATGAAVLAFQTLLGLPRTAVVDRAVWDRLELRDYPLLPYRALTLKQGSTGTAVAALQRALRLTADGAFGPLTAAGVKAVQLAAKLAPTGVVSGATWVAVENQMPR